MKYTNHSIQHEIFNFRFLGFLQDNGYLSGELFEEENISKFNKYMNEFIKVYSYEKEKCLLSSIKKDREEENDYRVFRKQIEILKKELS